MSENLTFKNYGPASNEAEAIYQVGSAEEHHEGVVMEMANAFNVELAEVPNVSSLGELIKSMAPEKELQRNIEHVREVLSRIGDPVDISRGWATRTALLDPVERTFMTAEQTEDSA